MCAAHIVNLMQSHLYKYRDSQHIFIQFHNLEMFSMHLITSGYIYHIDQILS